MVPAEMMKYFKNMFEGLTDKTKFLKNIERPYSDQIKQFLEKIHQKKIRSVNTYPVSGSSHPTNKFTGENYDRYKNQDARNELNHYFQVPDSSYPSNKDT